MKLIVGLGNPGKQYEQTRHNIGFVVIDALAEKLHISLDQAKFKGIYGYGHIDGEKGIFIKAINFHELIWRINHCSYEFLPDRCRGSFSYL